MKKLILMLVAISMSFAASAQQKNAYIYSQKIFTSMPEYTKAIETLENFQKMARSKIDNMLKEAKDMLSEYEKYRQNMSRAQESQIRNQIIQKEKQANDYEKEVFGEDGEFVKRQKELMEPIERKVMAVVESIAQKEGYDMIFDLSLAKVTIYQSPKLDLTDKVIEQVKNYNYK